MYKKEDLLSILKTKIYETRRVALNFRRVERNTPKSSFSSEFCAQESKNHIIYYLFLRKEMQKLQKEIKKYND